MPVRVWAKQYETFQPIAGAKVIDIPTGESAVTGLDGYADFAAVPGRVLALKLEKPGLATLQTASIAVPPEGLTGAKHEITLQAPGMWLYRILMGAFGWPKPGHHHLVTTVSACGKDLHDDDGEAGVRVTLVSENAGRRDDAIYLGNIFGLTEWILPILAARFPVLSRLRHESTSHDGGAIFLNVAPGRYELEAEKRDGNGKSIPFKGAEVEIFPGSPLLVNLSPPHGPRRLEAAGLPVFETKRLI